MPVTPTLMQIDKVPLADLIIRDRMRPVSEAGVESLIASVTELGVMKDAIHVRKKKDGSLHLMAGAHRTEMARRLGWIDIPAKVWTGVTDDWARLVEIDDNLAGAEMNPLDTAVFLAARKEVYERLHPEAKRGFSGGKARHGQLTDMMSVSSFAASTAEKFGFTDRHVRRMIAAGIALSGNDVTHLRQAKRPITLKDLVEIAKIGDPEERTGVVLRLSVGNAKSASDARKSLAQEQGRVSSPDPLKQSEREFRDLMVVWKRAGAATRRRFMAEIEGTGGIE